MSELVIVLAQINPRVGDISGNTDACIAAFQHARQMYAAEVVVFPELALMGYPAQDLLLRTAVQPRVDRALARLAAEVGDAWMIVGYPRRSERGVFNMAGVLHDGRLVAEYAKQELPGYPVFDDKRDFVAGQKPGVLLIRDIPVGLTIGEDLSVPGPAAQAAAAGARLLINLTASAWRAGEPEERERQMASRAREVGLPILSVNQTGGQDELVFDGSSVAIDDQGELLARAPQFQPASLCLRAVWQDGHCRLSSATPLLPRLEPMAMLYQALVTGLRDYVEKNGFPGVMLGLSGGIDSALSLAIAVDAIGAARVEAVMMPFRYTSGISRADAAEQAGRQGVRYHELPIEPIYDCLLGALAGEFAGHGVDQTEENIQARIRGLLLMALSNKKGGLVLTTSNKSELAVGYTTLYGDMAGGFDVLKDVYKTQVFELARYRNTLGAVIPERVITRPPSAELSPDQLDADSLPPYEVLDAILCRYIEEHEEAAEIIAGGFDADMVHGILRLVDRNEYKRRQAPIGVRVTRRSFGRDRRYPITSFWSADGVDGAGQ